MQEIWYSLIGDITSNSASDFITWVNSQVFTNPVKKLQLFIASEGGDVESALIIYRYIKGLPFETNIFGFNKIGSAANIIFVSSPHRFALTGCIFVLHEGTNTISNQTASLHQHEDSLMWMKDRVSRHVQTLSLETGKTKEEVEKAMSDTVFLTTEQAKAFGLLNDIIDVLPLQQVVQSVQ